MQWQGTLGCGGTWWDCKHLTGDTSTPFARQGALSQLGLKTHWHTPHHHYPNYTWQFRLILSLLTLRRTAITMLNQFFTLETREGLDPLQTRQLRLKPLTCPGWIRSKMPGTWVAGCSWVLSTISQRASVWTKGGGTSSGPWCKLTKPENSQFLGKP